MGRPIEPRQHRDLLQERQIPVGRAFRLVLRLAKYLSSLALAFFSALTLFMWGVPSTPESSFNPGFSLMCVNVSRPQNEAVCKRISAFAGLCECSTVEGLKGESLKASEC